MTMIMKKTTILISTLLAFNAMYIAEAFVLTSHRNARAESCLHLLPTQGNQLVEASQAVYPPRTLDAEDEEHVTVTTTTTTVPTSTARAFVSRVFSLPSSLIKKHPRAELEGLQRRDSTTSTAAEAAASLPSRGQEDNVVLYPVTGFQYIADAPNHCRAVPKVSSAACRLPNNRDDVVYGYFRPANPTKDAQF